LDHLSPSLGGVWLSRVGAAPVLRLSVHLLARLSTGAGTSREGMRGRARMKRLGLCVAVATVCLAACATPGPSGPGWRSLFDGKTLNGWTPKIRGFPLGENYLDTFSVRNGLLTVSYDKYDKFGERYGHLLYKTPFKAYKFRLEYRFIGKTPADTPGWAIANNGVMIFSQDPKTMAVGDSFPVSVEA